MIVNIIVKMNREKDIIVIFFYNRKAAHSDGQEMMVSTTKAGSKNLH